MEYVRMNFFQRLTLQWDKLHPYNAAQAMRVRVPADAIAIDQAWKATLLSLDLGQLDIRGNKYRHSARTSAVTFLSPGANVDHFISEQMNRPFDLASEGPFRACAIPDRDAHLLVIIYHHPLADSVSIRLLMREWFFHLAGEQVRNRPVTPLQQQLESNGDVELPFSIASLVDWRCHGRFVRRLPEQSLEDLTVKHQLLRLPNCSSAALHNAAKSRGVKVTDLLMCTMATVCDRHFPTLNSRRPDIALGSIRDLRPSHETADPDAFGSMLAVTTLICPHEVLSNRDLLLENIAQQNDRNRKPASFHGRNVDKRVALAAEHVLKPEKMLQFYRKRLPLSAGLSNVNLSGTWVGDYRDHIDEYYRVSPAGPMLPIVLTPTTLNDKVNISLTWRRSLFTKPALAAFVDDLLDDLQSWMSSPARVVAYEPAA